MSQKLELEVPWATIYRIVAVVFGGWFIIQIRDILALLFMVAVIVASLNPLVDRWSDKMPRWMAVTWLFGGLSIGLATIFTLLIPPLVIETQALIERVAELTRQFLPTISDQLLTFSNLSSFSQSFSRLGGQIYSTTIGALGGLVAFMTMVVLTFYLLLEQHRARDYLYEHLPLDRKEEIISILKKISQKMGAWVRGQLYLAIIIGGVTFIALLVIKLIFGLPYVLTLAVWAALTELIPYIGPILGAIPAVLLALSISPLVALIVLLVYIFIQQLESHVVVPRLMQKAVGLSPVTIIIVLLIGGRSAGLVGVILAVPAAAALSVLIQEWSKFKKIWGK